MAYTVAFQPELDGFTSFFSFQPEMMIGMNNFLYTFKEGQIWKHYINNTTRNSFYGVTYSSIVDITFNNDPTEVKIFKTLSFDGIYPTSVVSAILGTTLSGRSYTGTIGEDEFTVKEGESYAFIRSSANSSYGTTLKDSGIGKLVSYNIVTLPYYFEVYSPADLAPPSTVSGGVTVLDELYYIDGTDTALLVTGQLTGYSKNGNLHRYYCNATVLNTPTLGSTMILSKNIVAESFGLRGSYMNAKLTILSVDIVEIFSVSSEVMQSKP